VNGGRIVVVGTPEDVAAEKKSFTGQYLKPLLERASVQPARAKAQPDLIAAK
jgi:excinuclease ABC subunit A